VKAGADGEVKAETGADGYNPDGTGNRPGGTPEEDGS
jgi:hypothetical protein